MTDSFPPQLRYYKTIRADGRSPSEYAKDILLLIEAHRERLEQRQVRKTEVARDLSAFVNEAVLRQQDQETRNRRAAHAWYAAGFMCLLLVLAVAASSSYHVLLTGAAPVSLLTPIMLALLNLVVIGVLAALARYSYSLGKSYMSEALKSADRIHAIQFGKFFLSLFGEKLSPEEVKVAFQHWNIDRQSIFATLDPAHVDPQIFSLFTQLSSVISAKRDKQAVS